MLMIFLNNSEANRFVKKIPKLADRAFIRYSYHLFPLDHSGSKDYTGFAIWAHKNTASVCASDVKFLSVWLTTKLTVLCFLMNLDGKTFLYKEDFPQIHFMISRQDHV